jgi:hypothetical protein
VNLVGMGVCKKVIGVMGVLHNPSSPLVSNNEKLIL